MALCLMPLNIPKEPELQANRFCLVTIGPVGTPTKSNMFFFFVFLTIAALLYIKSTTSTTQMKYVGWMTLGGEMLV